jgi:hypothetical protein
MDFAGCFRPLAVQHLRRAEPRPIQIWIGLQGSDIPQEVNVLFLEFLGNNHTAHDRYDRRLSVVMTGKSMCWTGQSIRRRACSTYAEFDQTVDDDRVSAVDFGEIGSPHDLFKTARQANCLTHSTQP